MKQKKGLNNKKRISNDPNIYIRRHGETLGNVGHRILTQLKALSDARLTTNIVNLSRSKLLPKICKPLYNKDTHYQILSTKNFVNSNHYVYWALGLFFNCAKELKIFNTARIEFNLSLLSSDLPRANAALNTVESVSHCWWAISNRIHVIKELDKAPTKEIINRIQDNFPNHDVSSKIRDILLMSESNNISVFASILEAQLKEYRASGLKGIISYGAVLSCMQLPIAFDKNRKVSLEDLNNYRMESIVDQYLLFKTILSEIYVRGESLDPTIEKLSLELAEILQDEELFNLLNRNHDVDVATMAIVDDYTRGNYNSVIEAVSKAISGGLELTFGLIEIYARAKVYVGSTTDKHLYDHIANSLSSIFMLQPNSDECIAYLRKLCVKFRSEVWAKSLMFHLTHILSEVEEDQVIELSRRATLALGRWNTPKAFTSIQKRALFTDVEISRIPSERAIRHGYEDSEKLHLTPSHFPILADYLKVQSARYIQKQDWMSLINFSIDSYFKNRFASYYLPMATICGEIADLDKPDNATFISCLITLDIYNREQNGAYEELKTELFIDLLGAKKTHKPTILFPGETLEENEKYFLRYICVPFQLDNIGAFKNNDQVIHERVAILDRLILASPEIAEALKIEKDKVLETLFSDKLRAKIETGKLFVDIQALETHRKHYYKKLFDQAKSIEGGTALAPLNLKDFDKSSTDILEIESGDTGLPLAVSSNEKTSLLYKIFTAAARDFALNENYGLDKYLSAEIRHTVFVTQLRACFEKAKLITVEKNGEYLPNTYWEEKYSYLTAGIKEEIDIIFRGFSRKVDTTLKDINNHFRVHVDGAEKNNYIFDFSAYYSRLVHISKILDNHDKFDSFFDSLIEYMWQLAAEHAKKAQNLINDTLHSLILNDIHNLESEITTSKARAPMGELMQEIRNCRSSFSKEIELVLNWFKFVGSDGVESFEPLGVVLEASVTSFQSIYGHKGAEITFSQQKSDLILNYRESRSLFIALFTAIENAVKYRKFESAVQIAHSTQNNTDTVTVQNLIDVESFGDKQVFISHHKARWNDSNSNLSREEGGSGIYKIYNLLHNSSPGFSYNIEATDDNFISTIGLKHENFSNRR